MKKKQTVTKNRKCSRSTDRQHKGNIQQRPKEKKKNYIIFIFDTLTLDEKFLKMVGEEVVTEDEKMTYFCYLIRKILYEFPSFPFIYIYIFMVVVGFVNRLTV